MKTSALLLVAALGLAWGVSGWGNSGGASADGGGFVPASFDRMSKTTVNLDRGASITLVLISKGKFTMGAPDTEPNSPAKERPRREVTITKPFYIGQTEVTQAQYEAVMGVNPSRAVKGADNPVDWVSWNEARQFCSRLSEKTGKTFRLPTEAEWEYACRAGTDTPWFWGDKPNDIGQYAWYKGNSDLNVTHPVGKKKPNPWGLYDMIGNVWELCYDGDSGQYDINDTTDPTGNKYNPGIKVARGGSMNYDSDTCRAAYRLAQGVDIHLLETGFRVVMEKE